MELAADLTPDALQDLLAELGDRVAPTALARERTLPLHPALRPLFPESGLVRGRIHACSGSGATTVAMALARDAVVAGAWLALVDVATFGGDAATELGIPLERVVRIDVVDASASDEGDGDAARRWLEVMAAVVDGFDVVLATVPAELRRGRPSAAVRSLIARLQQRGTVVITLGPVGVLPVDVACSSTGSWAGLGRGHGLIRRRSIEVEASGRRMPRSRRCSIELAAEGSQVVMGDEPGPSSPDLSSLDPSSQVVAEMLAADLATGSVDRAVGDRPSGGVDDPGDDAIDPPLRLAAG
ncbi:MAG: hypothetical protein AAFP84_21685 [Actinomycetota bacterium]